MGRAVWQTVVEVADPGMVKGLVGSIGTMQTWTLIIAGAFVVFTMCLSFYLLFEHLATYNCPAEQKWLIGIIFMVPVYTWTSFLSLWMPGSMVGTLVKILGNCYEAFALYSFGRYLIACMGEEEMAVQRLAKQGSVGPHTPLLDEHRGKYFAQHPFPFGWFLQPWELGRPFYDTAKFGIVQYMILKVVGSLLGLVLEPLNLYGDGEFDFSKGYPYITIVLNFSQMWALYCLIQFYYVTKHELHKINPLAKFLCFKAVVFVTWWQGVVIALVFWSGLASQWFPPEKMILAHVQTSLQDFIICVEMAIAAVAHIFVYPAKPYQNVGSKKQNINRIGSVVEEIEEDVEVVATSVKESVQDVVLGGGGHVVEDVKTTMTQAVEPIETGITMINETLHDNVTKINETVQETFQSWGSHHKEEVSKEGTYLVKDGDDDDSSTSNNVGVVEIEEAMSYERDPERNEEIKTERFLARGSSSKGGIVRGERTEVKNADGNEKQVKEELRESKGPGESLKLVEKVVGEISVTNNEENTDEMNPSAVDNSDSKRS